MSDFYDQERDIAAEGQRAALFYAKQDRAREQRASLSLGDALPARMKEIREVYIPAYRECGAAGSFAIAMMNDALTRAERALAAGDLTEMISVYQELMEFKI
ncbi:hypothetical protein D2T31_00595 [Sinirhodobacter populi]|uniref:Uncharacterized protein n=1 Tax=Paenirhodobacter populi TaxID=2306993 RepID=A0A443KIG5_9RHOB|nr:hypothetical protein [Sinirhodobacter populi]RWR32516.1 hypothetical protein D2T31_00595 [Sinirhodobacter populi]